MGNLVQHFVALCVVKQVVAVWNQSSVPIEYIDCYSMGVWEELEPSNTPQRRQFLNTCSTFPDMKTDFVASTFTKAWMTEYRRALPVEVGMRKYPNTALLLTTAFPEQLFEMRLHDVFDDNYRQLVSLARKIGPQRVQVDKDWTQSRLIHNRPACASRPVVVMLDPYRFVSDDHEKANHDGYLRTGLVEYLIGSSALGIHPPTTVSRTAPCVVILCSYSEANPNIPDAIVSELFREGGWFIEKLVAGPFPDVGNVKSHVVWVATLGYSVPILGVSIQKTWNQWFEPMQETV